MPDEVKDLIEPMINELWEIHEKAIQDEVRELD